MDIIDGIILGIIQGLTEFLPVSSSGHLLLAGRILGYSPDIALELVAHLGTLLALLLVLRKPIFDLFRHPLGKRTRLILLSTVVTGIVFLTCEPFFRAAYDGSLLPIGFLLTAFLLTLAHFLPTKQRSVGVFESILIGFAQGAAGLPGLSRSGTTVSSARILGIDKKESTEYSFLLALPIILGSTVYEIIGGGFIGLQILPAMICFLSAFITGLISLKLCLKLFTSDHAVYFAVYLVLLSVFLLLNDFVLHIL